MFNEKFHYKWSFSIAMLVYQRVDEDRFKAFLESPDKSPRVMQGGGRACKKFALRQLVPKQPKA